VSHAQLDAPAAILGGLDLNGVLPTTVANLLEFFVSLRHGSSFDSPDSL
jgi:hypothetical protein